MEGILNHRSFSFLLSLLFTLLTPTELLASSPSFSLTGTATDLETGLPIPNATIRLCPFEKVVNHYPSERKDEEIPWTDSAQTDEKGVFHFENIASSSPYPIAEI